MPDDTEPQEEAVAEEPASVTPRPFWSGTLSFGLVSIPVSLYPASRRESVALRMLAPDGTPLARRYYCAEEDVEVDPDHLVRGYELEDGSYVVLSDEELEAADPQKSRDIDLRLFVPAADVDPIYFERSYVLTSGSESTKAYRLLAKVMEAQRRAGIATFVMRENEYVVAIFAERGVLHAETLRFADEVRPVEGIDVPEEKIATAALVKDFARSIARHAKKELNTRELRDAQNAALREHLEEKRKRGKDVIRAEESVVTAAPHAEVIDLMEVLKRSLRGEEPEAKGEERSARARSRNPHGPAKAGAGGRAGAGAGKKKRRKSGAA